MCEVYKLKELDLHANARPIYYYINENGCHVCTSHRKDRDGYVRIERLGKEWLTHRYIYFVNHGKIPDGKVIMHRCDNPSCVNIDHLQVGSQAENMQDMVKKGRASTGGKKLTEDEIDYIEKNLSSTIAELARVLEVSHGTIVRARSKIRSSHRNRRVSAKPSVHESSRIRKKKLN